MWPPKVEPRAKDDSKANEEIVLVNFFNSLLSCKKQPGSKGGGLSRVTCKNEAAAEIDRMQSKKGNNMSLIGRTCISPLNVYKQDTLWIKTNLGQGAWLLEYS